MSLRSTLRTTGPIPLSKLTPLIADELLETIGKEGVSLAKFLDKYPSYTHTVHLPGHIIIAMGSNVYLYFDSNERRKLGIWVMALLSAAHHLPGQPPVVALGLSAPHPTILELSNALRHWTIVSPVQLAAFLRSFPDIFTVFTPTRRVRLNVLNSIAHNDHIQRTVVGGLVPLLKTVKTQDTSKFALWLRTVVPSQFHIPVSHVLLRARELNVMETTFGTEAPTLDQIKARFQQLPSGFADIRAFGDSPNTVFIRVIDPEPLLLDSGVSTYGGDSTPPEVDAAQHNPTQLAQELTAAIEHYASQTPLTRARVVKGIAMSRLRDYVPAALMQRLEAFYGFSARDDPSVCILLLDRLRHLWEVQLSAGTARPWTLLAASEMPSSLTLQTSPSPRVLQHCQRLLLECGAQPLMELYHVLPSDLKMAFLELYGDATKQTATNEGVAHPVTPQQPDDASILAAVQAFLRVHSLYFFIKDGLAHTSRSPANREDERNPHQRKGEGDATVGGVGAARGLRDTAKKGMLKVGSAAASDAEIAKSLYDAIPRDTIVLVDSLRNSLGLSTAEVRQRRHRGIPVQSIRREFINRFPQYFKQHFLLGHDKITVSRADANILETHLMVPRINTIGRLLKMMALFSLNSISDASLTRRLPLDGRDLLKGIGSATDLAEQLPMWFAVQRDDRNFGSSLIRYIGPIVETERSAYALKPHPSGTLTRKVPNDPFADITPDNLVDGHVDGWNSEWDEVDDSLAGNNSWDDDTD